MKSGGERPFAVVVKDSDHAARMHEADIKAHLQAFAGRGVISKFGIPEKIEFVDALAKRRASARSTRSFCVKRMRTSRNGRRPDDRQNERRVWGRARRLRNYTSGIEFSLVMPRETVAIALATICRDLPGFSGARWRMLQIETQRGKTKKDGVQPGHRHRIQPSAPKPTVRPRQGVSMSARYGLKAYTPSSRPGRTSRPPRTWSPSIPPASVDRSTAKH